MTSKKLTVKKVIAIVVLTTLACLGLFGVMLITLILTQSATAVLIAIYAYGAIVVLLCTVPGRKKGFRFKAGVSLLLLVTLGCFVALGGSYVSYCGYRDRILTTSEPIVEPFLAYDHTLLLLSFIGALTCVWIWVGYNYRKARSATPLNKPGLNTLEANHRLALSEGQKEKQNRKMEAIE